LSFPLVGPHEPSELELFRQPRSVFADQTLFVLDAGKGFAVVAWEVRGLTRRAA